MTGRQSGAGDARIALLASWAVVAVLIYQGVGSMLTQVTDELSAVTRSIGVLGTLVCATVFVLAQLRVVGGRRVPTAWWVTGLVAAGAAFAVGAWLNAPLGIGLLGLALSGRRLTLSLVASLVVLASFLTFYAVELRTVTAVFYVLAIGAIALLLHVLTRLALVVQELMLARETVARLRVEEERDWIERDLHDLLGRSLAAISLRVQAAGRLLDRDLPRGREQLDAAASLIAESQGQLRGLIRGPQVTGLDDELRSARDLLSQMKIEHEVTGGSIAPSGSVADELGARVVRESVTNLLKHSRPRTVQILLSDDTDGYVLAIRNDGVTGAASDPRPGTGLADLAVRVGDEGGTLAAAPLTDGRFEVVARIPVGPAA